MVKYVSRLVDNCDFAARAVSGVQTYDYLALKRRLHQKRLEVNFEHLYRLFVSLVGKLVSHFALYRREYKTRVAVLYRLGHYRIERAVL